MADSESQILQTFPLGAQWPTMDPFLFVAHHRDAYPPGQDDLGPAPEELTGRNIGSDFSERDGWSMYHGSRVPGFPQHPHRGFETITHLRSGHIDHSDSMGATARFGPGDTQWMTAGAGVQHCEMMPLLNGDGPNFSELFQIWLNLPAVNKMVDPYFTMLWREDTPTVELYDSAGARTGVTVIAGTFGDAEPLAAPPDSWAADPSNDVAVWHIEMSGGAVCELPAAQRDGTGRVLYFFEGSTVEIDGESAIDAGTGVVVDASVPVALRAGDGGMKLMVLQGRPLNEPVAQHGPFVMTTRAEVMQAFEDYQRTQFGGWPWNRPDPDHGPEQGRFARFPDGSVGQPA